jgi:Lrp/AsnC family leucine-responsive transcriptional regulator
MASKPHPVDPTDRHILTLLQQDASLPQTEVARRVGLSPAAIHERVKKLETAGVLRRWTVIVDPVALGQTVTAFVNVAFEHPRFEAGYLERVRQTPEVLECHQVTGDFALLLKVRVPDMAALQRLLLDRLTSHDGVRRTRTDMVLSTDKEDTFLDTGFRENA